MAKTVAQYQQQIIEAKEAEAALSELTSTSQVSYWRLWTFILAVGYALFDQVLDIFRAEMESKQSSARPLTAAWVQEETFKFQYDPTTPQVIQLNDLAFQYAVPDPTLRIITRCSVTTDIKKRVNIKVARNEPPEPLDALQYPSLQGYWGAKGGAGIEYNIINAVSDKLMVEAQVFMDGQYFSTASATVIAAIEAYMAGIPFNGVVVLSELENAIQAVPGVKDIKITKVTGRADSIPLVNANVVYELATGTNARSYSTYSGYIVQEDTAGNTFADTLTFFVQP